MSMNQSLRDALFRTSRIIVAATLVLVTFNGVLVQRASAAPYEKLGRRSLTIGSSVPGAITTYTIRMSWPTNTSVGSLRFLMCEDYQVDQPCPSTLSGDMSGAVLSNTTGPFIGWGINNATTDEVLIGRAAPASTGTGMFSFTFDNIVNPSGLHHRFYIQIFSYTSTDGSGTPTNMSSVASATAEPIVITTKVPPILYFCAGITVTMWCTNTVGNFLNYNDLLDSSDNFGTSQFGVSTNALGGYVVTINGHTMASGNKTIDALTIPTARQPGTSQFGINLRANTDPAVGADINGTGIGTVSADYNTPDLFKYNDGDIIASAVTGTMFDTFTVTYIANVPPDQPSGIYNTTVTYICTAAF